MAITEQLFKPLISSQTIQAEPIMDSKSAKELKKQLEKQRKQGLIEARPVKRITTTTTTTIEFEADEMPPPAY